MKIQKHYLRRLSWKLKRGGTRHGREITNGKVISVEVSDRYRGERTHIIKVWTNRDPSGIGLK